MSTDPSEEKTEIAKFQATPKVPEEGVFDRRQFLTWEGFGKWFRKKCELADSLVEQTATAHADLITNKAAKVGEEAGEAAARKDELVAKTDIAKQHSVREFINSVREIGDLPEGQQPLAILKLMQENPGLEDQIERVQDVMNRLSMMHGTHLVALPKQEPARAGADQGNLIEASVSDGIGLGDQVRAEVKRANPETDQS